MVMDICRNWCSSGNMRSSRSTIRLGRHDHHDDHQSSSCSSSSSTVTISPRKPSYWKVLWARLKKKGIIVCEANYPVGDINHNNNSDHHRCGSGMYDPCSYSQNFDHGFAWDDHDDEPDHDDNLSRSFSFRFSDPSCHIFADLHKEQNTNINIGLVRNELCV